jgi:uncharacterized protein YjbI with pentapeptide repeats
MAAAFEEFIRRAPTQWHLMQPNWPTDLDPTDLDQANFDQANFDQANFDQANFDQNGRIGGPVE